MLSKLNKESLSLAGKSFVLWNIINHVHTSFPREYIERSAKAVDLAYRFQIGNELQLRVSV